VRVTIPGVDSCFGRIDTLVSDIKQQPTVKAEQRNDSARPQRVTYLEGGSSKHLVKVWDAAQNYFVRSPRLVTAFDSAIRKFTRLQNARGTKACQYRQSGMGEGGGRKFGGGLGALGRAHVLERVEHGLRRLPSPASGHETRHSSCRYRYRQLDKERSLKSHRRVVWEVRREIERETLSGNSSLWGIFNFPATWNEAVR